MSAGKRPHASQEARNGGSPDVDGGNGVAGRGGAENGGSSRTGSVRIHDTTVSIWEDHNDDTMNRVVLGALVAFLRSRGWRARQDETVAKIIRSSYYVATKGPMNARIDCHGRALECVLWSADYPSDHPTSHERGAGVSDDGGRADGASDCRCGAVSGDGMSETNSRPRRLRFAQKAATDRLIARETAHIRAVAEQARRASARVEARLLAEVERLEAENAELREMLKGAVQS